MLKAFWVLHICVALWQRGSGARGSCVQSPILACRTWAGAALLLAALLVAGTGSAEPAGDPPHGIAMHGQPALPAGFRHFPYVDPNAPRGGTLHLGVLGTFDNLNPFIIRGNSPESIRGYVFESLMARSADEPFTLYGLIAERITVGDGRSSITFHLRPEARFSDGVSITSADVAFSHRVLKAKGPPYMRSHYSKVVRVETPDAHTIRFDFGSQKDREVALIVGLMPVLPRHAFDEETFERTTLAPVIGSGPYTIDSVAPGRQITYRRNSKYWGWHLAVNKGRHNFDTVKVEYFRDDAALFEAFKTGQIDVRMEDDPARWAVAYNFPAVSQGRIVLREAPNHWPAGMLALAFNTRRELFKDARVRRAFIEMFHFSEINRLLYNGLYRRSRSYFARSDLASEGHVASPEELKIIAPFAKSLPPAILAGAGYLPESSPFEALRPRLVEAQRLLSDAGWDMKDGRLVNRENGRPFAFEFLALSRSQERLMLAFARTLRRMGIDARVRQVDSSQYRARLRSFDFDMVQWRWTASLSPGNEQIHRWSSRYADVEGSLNYAGVRDPAVDAAIDAMLAAVDRGAFEAAVRALDRVLLSGEYVIPLFHADAQWVAYWNVLKSPSKVPLSGLNFDTWWRDDGASSH